MAYRTDYEPAAGYVMGQVLIWTQNMLGGGTAFGTATNPSLAQVESLIDARTLMVQGMLAQRGYGTAQLVATVGTPVATILSQAIAFGVIADIEMSRPTLGGKLEENPRFRAFASRWDQLGTVLQGASLEYMGALRARDASAGMMVTGSSWAEQEAIERDPDAKGALFGRGFLDHVDQRSHPTEYEDRVPQ